MDQRRRVRLVSRLHPRAFTLIELLVVIVIIAILMAIAIPAFLSQQVKAKDAKAKQYLAYAYRDIRSSTPETNNQFPASASMVSWVQQADPELTTSTGSCYALGSLTANTIVVDSGSSSGNLTLCTRSDSGNIWKLTATPTGVPSFVDGSVVPLSVSGNEQTDAARALGLQGDGLSNDSSTGVWEGTTNLVTDGGFETNTNGWSSGSGGAFSRDTSLHKFGAASLKVTADGSTSGQGAYITFPVTTGTTYTASVWVNGDSIAGKPINVRFDITGTYSQAFTVGAGWQRLTYTHVADGTGTGDIFIRTGGGAYAGTFWIDGVQVEQKPYATPYVETNGAIASRSDARVQVPAALLNTSQGWWTMRVRVGFPSTANPYAGSALAFSWWGDDSNNHIDLTYDPTSQTFHQRRVSSAGGTAVAQSSSQSFAADSVHTLVGKWTATGTSISVDGGPFSSVTLSNAPTLAATSFDIGARSDSFGQWADSSVLWFATGTGTLADADAVTINGFGNNDPSVSSFPTTAQADFVWNGVSSTGSLK
jgi:prepilin-type N-terminal cleavage/methylation domain-containing protein